MAQITNINVPSGKKEPVTIEVSTAGASGDGPLTAEAFNDQEEIFKVNIEQVEDGNYRLTFSPPCPAVYTLSVKWGEEPLPDTPLKLNLNKADSKAVILSQPPGGNIRPGERITIGFNTSKAGRGALTSTCSAEGEGDIPVEIERKGFSSDYLVSFFPPHEDVYTLQVKWAGKNVKGSPFHIDMIPVLPSRVTSRLVMPEEPGGKIELHVCTKGAGNAKLNTKCKGEKVGELTVETKKQPPYDYQFIVATASEPDKYTFEVMFAGHQIPNSPFVVDMVPVLLSKVTSDFVVPEEAGGKIELHLCTKGAGNANLEATCKGDTAGVLPLERNETPPHDCHFIATTPKESADKYTFDVTFGGHPIPGSPFTVSLSPPAPVGLGAPGVKHLETCLPNSQGSPVSLTFDTSKAGEGALRARVAGTVCGVVDHNSEVLLDADHKTKVTFVPPHADSYIVDVYWNDVTVPSSPFFVDVLDPTKLVFGELRSAEVDVPWELNVDTSNAGPGKITASCKGERSGDVNVYVESLVESVGSGKYIINFCPPQSDTYTLIVFFDGKEVRQFVVRVGLGAPGVKHLETHVPDTQGSPVSLTFDTSKAGEGVLRARVAGTVCGVVDHNSEVLPDADHKTKVTFVPPRADLYVVDIYWNDATVPGSPFSVDVLDPTKLVFGELRFAEVDVPLELKVDTSDAGPGKITASCKGERLGDVDVYIEENLAEAGSGKFFISFRPPQYDSYTLLVFFNGKEVRQFVVKVDEPTPDPPEPFSDGSKCIIFGLSSRKLYFTGEKIVFGVDAKQAGEGRLNVKIAGPAIDEDQPPEISINSSEAHIYNIEYTPNVPGEQTIQLKWNDDLIPESPVVFLVEDGDKIPTFPMTKPYKIFFVADCDPEDIQAYITHEGTAVDESLVVGKRRNGKVKLVYTAKQPGIHTFHVLISGSEVPGSPFRVKFIKSDPKGCRLLDVPDVAYVGEESCFKIDAQKAGSGELHVRARVPSGGSGIATRHVYHNNGFYSIYFTAQIVGKHFFDISWGREPILESPVRIAVEQREEDYEAAKKEAAKVHVLKEDLYIFDMALPYSLPAYVCISTGLAGKGKLTLKTTGPGEAKTSVIDRDNGVYTAEIRPSITGLYTLGIFWNDIHIEGSPHKLNFTKEKSYLINGLDLDREKFLIDVPYTFHLHCPQEEKPDPQGEECDPQKEERDPQKKERSLSIMCTPTTAASISCTPFENDPNSYLCVITPKEEGNHEISIKYNDYEVHNSPHYVQFDKNPDSVEESDNHLAPLDISIDMTTPVSAEPLPSDPVPSKVKAYGPGLGNSLVIGQEGFFTIETENAGDGSLEVDVYGPKGAFKVNIRRHPENIRTLLARYDPKVVGDYTIGVLWDGEHIPKSPFEVHISDQSRVEPIQVDTTIEL